VPFLQEAVRKFDIVHPITGEIFPKVLPREAFPERPSEEMTKWYNGVSEKLEKEAEAEQEGSGLEQPREHTRDNPRQRQRRDVSPPHGLAGGSAEMPNEADYLRTHYGGFRERNGREGVIYVTPPVSPYQFGNLRSRRRSFPEEIYNQGLRRSPDTLHSHHHDGARRRKSHSPMRRNSIDSSSGSESDTESITDTDSPTSARPRRDNQLSPSPQQKRFTSPVLVHRRSRDLPGLHDHYDTGARGRGDYSYETYHHHGIPSQREGFLHHQPLRGSYRGQGAEWNNVDSAYHLSNPGGVTSATGSVIGRRISPESSVDRDWARGGRGFRRILPHPKGLDGRRYPSYY
jgi:hypothetical protein